ncbi:hypothetical protein Pcinc_034419 [Petrolisthes cinctipes]|uniref:Uncharacterized protein n=1 Tax=Petrolisthes cinctipes TaxID=88211 RepID=A0AAE1EQD3_PETCI|nr:hypothetical protein Pcinc_034419 [Petrolisthes cinctipes]
MRPPSDTIPSAPLNPNAHNRCPPQPQRPQQMPPSTSTPTTDAPLISNTPQQTPPSTPTSTLTDMCVKTEPGAFVEI